MSIDILFITPNSSKKVYQDLSKDYSAIEPPTWSLLLAQSCRAKNYKVNILAQMQRGLMMKSLLIGLKI